MRVSILELRIPVRAAAAGRQIQDRPQRGDVGRVARVLPGSAISGVISLAQNSRTLSPSRLNTMSAAHSEPSR